MLVDVSNDLAKPGVASVVAGLYGKTANIQLPKTVYLLLLYELLQVSLIR